MKNVTLSADERLIEAARRRAATENTTLNEEFRRWLDEYAGDAYWAEVHRKAMETIKYLQGKISTGGRHFTRDELNERR